VKQNNVGVEMVKYQIEKIVILMILTMLDGMEMDIHVILLVN
jgi:hypothetical protein